MLENIQAELPTSATL